MRLINFSFGNSSTFDGVAHNTFETDGASVSVVGKAGTHDHGSSKIKLKNIVDYKWEVKNYIGRLIAVHFEGNYVAYAIKGKRTAVFSLILLCVHCCCCQFPNFP